MGEEEEGDAKTDGEAATIMARSKFTLKSNLTAIAAQIKANNKEALELTAREVVYRTRSAVPIDTGDLRNSYTYEFKNTFTIRVGSNKLMGPRVRKNETYYAPWVEFGLDGHPMQPHFLPAFNAARGIFTRHFQKLMANRG